jgi:hypothetical protein
MEENKREGGEKGMCLLSSTLLNFRVNPILGLTATEGGKMQLINVAMQVRSPSCPSLFHS